MLPKPDYKIHAIEYKQLVQNEHIIEMLWVGIDQFIFNLILNPAVYLKFS